MISTFSYIIATWMVGKYPKLRYRNQAVVPIYNLQIPEVSCFSKPVSWEVATPHLSQRVMAGRSCIDYLSTELHHASMVC